MMKNIYKSVQRRVPVLFGTLALILLVAGLPVHVDAAVSGVTLSANPASPQLVNTPVIFTAVATGGTGTVEYEFSVKDPVSGVMTTLQPYGTATTFPYTPVNPGTYTIRVYARNMGSMAAYEAAQLLNYNVTIGYLNFAWQDDTYGNNEILFKKSTDGGATWPASVRVTDNTGNSQNPVMVVNGGTVYVAWQDDYYGNNEILFKKSTDGGVTWPASTRVTINDGNSQNPVMVVDGSTVYVAWQDDYYGNNEILFKKSTDGGATWPASVRVTDNTGNSRNPVMVVAGGTVYVAWQDDYYGNNEILFKKSTDGGATWPASVRVINDPANSENPVMVVDGSAIYVAWQDDRYGNNEILFKKSIDGGATWPGAIRVSDAPGNSRNPVMVAHGNTVYVAWQDDRYGNNEILFKKSIDGGATWPIAIRATDNSGNSQNPAMVFTIVPIYTITAAAAGYGSISPPGTISVLSGDTPTFTCTPNTGYHVSDVLVDGSSVGTPLSYTFPAVVSNHTITASFSNTYAINATAGSNGTISPSGAINVLQGANQTYTITPNANYHVSDVLVDGVSVGRVTSYLFSNVAATHSISAYFASDTIINGGTITENTTWTLAGSPYTITNSVTVSGTLSSPALLTIEPGVVVKFNNNTGLNIANGSWYPGGLSAVGTASAPIVFTSNDPSPSPGKWSGIVFGSGTMANSALDYVTVEYGGGNGQGNLYISSASPTITNSIIQKSSTTGISATSSSAVIQNNTIVNNATYGHYDAYSAQPSVVSGNTFSGNGSYPAHIWINQAGSTNTYGTNGINAIEVAGNYVSQNLTMRNNGIPYIITDTVTVSGTSSSPALLTIEPGVIVKFNNNTGLNIANGPWYPGGLYSVGTTSASIIFTSNDPAPAPGKWKGITFNDGTVGASSVLNHVTVEYGGGLPPGYVYNYGNIVLFSASPTITNSIIQKSLKAGIYVASASAALITRNTVINNATYGIYASASPNTKVNSNDIYNNAWYGVYNASEAPRLDAKSNWWGDRSGPNHSTNPSGLGNKVGDYVDFAPWLNYTNDIIPPTVSIDPVMTPTSLVSQTLTGSMTSGATIAVSTNTWAVAGAASYPTSSTWMCTVTGLAAGENIITVTATDSAGVYTTAIATITSTMSTSIGPSLSNVAVSKNSIDVSAVDAASIFFTIDGAATVNLYIIPEKQGPTGAPLYTATQTCGGAGAYLFTWDGKSNAGTTVPDGAYLYILEAVVDSTRTGLYSPDGPTAAATLSCTKGETFDPYRNNPLLISCELSDPAYVTLAVNYPGNGAAHMIDVLSNMDPIWICQKNYQGIPMACKFYTPTSINSIPNSSSAGKSSLILDNAPKNSGSFTATWGGRDSNNGIHALVDTLASTAQRLYSNTIITTGNSPSIDNVTIDPYNMDLSFGEVATISYTISRDASVTIQLVSPSNTSVTLLSGQLQTAGQHAFVWNGLDASDVTLKKFAVSEEGYYTVVISAANPVNGASSVIRRTLYVSP